VLASVLAAGVAGAGDAVAVLGTTFAVLNLSTDPVPPGPPVGATLAWTQPGLFVRVLGSSSGSGVLDWFLRLTGYEGEDRHDRFWAEVAAARPGPELALPFVYGERVPFVAPGASGALVGLTPATTRAEAGRAIVQSLAFALRHCLESGGAAGSLVLTGGATASAGWTQLIADTVGLPVAVDADPQIGLRGVASLVPGFEHLRWLGRERRTVEPRAQESARLAESYRRYLELIERMAPTWPKTP
jgi:sugar (pentulose or hexulose) kinase